METLDTQRAKNTMLWMKILLALSILGFVHMIAFHFVVGDETTVDNDLYKPMFVGVFVIYFLHFISFIISLVVFTLWLKSISLFIPIANLYKPYMIMKKLCENKKSEIDLWELLWIMINILLYIFLMLFIYMISLPSPFTIMLMLLIYIIKQIIDIPFALVTIKVISNVMKKEQVN